MEASIQNSSTSSTKSVAKNYEMDSSNEDIDQQVLREAGEQTISAEWSATVSALNSSDTTSSNSYINIETLKECCANPSDTLNDKEDFMVFESSSTVVNISKFNANDTKYSEYKTTAFQKKHKPFSQNVSRYFENVLDDDSQMEITQNSICLNCFQKRKRLIPPNDEDFIEINNSNFSGSNSVDVSMMKSPKFCFSRKKKDQFEIPDYNLSATDNDSIANNSNISKKKHFSLVINESTDKNVSKTEVFTHKFNLKTIDVADSAFENIINNSSIISDITLNNKKTSLNETALSNVNNTSVFSQKDLSNLNHTYDIIPTNTNSTLVKALIADDADTSKVKQNTFFKKPSNISILVNDSSNNIMDVSKTEVFTQKFSRKSVGVPDSAFDNIINDSSMTSDIVLINKKSFLNETSVSNINNSKMDKSNLNYTYDISTHINTSTIDACISDDANMASLKQNTAFKKQSNSSILVNESSNNIVDISKTSEVLTHKFSRKTIDVADSVFDNIINDSSITSNVTLNNKNTSLNEIPVSNVDDPVLNKIELSNLNHTYDIPTNIDISTAGNADLPKVKQDTDLKKPTNSSLVVNNSSDNIDVSKTEVLTHKFSRKTIDVTHSVFDNIINDSSMTSEIALNNKKVSLFETSVSNVNSTPVFSTMDVSNLNHTYDVPKNNNTTLLDAIVEHDKSISETPVLIQNKSFNQLPLKFNFSNKFGRHSLSLQENCPSFVGVKKHNISLNTDFIINTGEESTSFQKSANNSNVNLKLHPHISIIQEDNSSPEIHPLDDSLPTNRLNQEQLKSKHSINSNSNNDVLLLSNTITSSLESNESQKNQPNDSMSSTSTNEGLTLLNSTSGLLGSCSSSRTQSRLLTSKQSKSSTSNNDTLNLTMESLNNNESQKDKSKQSISSTSSNDDLTLINSTTGFSVRRNSSRNKSTSSKYSTNITSNNDSLTLLNTTMESLKSNESLKNQSKGSKSPTSFNESLKSTNSTTEYSRKRSSSRNKSTSSKHSTSAISNNESLTSLNDSKEVSVGSSSYRSKSTSSKHSTSVISNNESLTSLNDIKEVSIGSNSSRNKSSTSSKHSSSVISNSDNLILLNASMGLLKNNESQKTQSKRSISPTSYNESLKSINSTAEYSRKRSLSRNKSTSSKHSTSVISNNESLTSLNDSKEVSVGSSSYRSKSTSSKHSTSVISNNESLTSLNDSTEILVGTSSTRSKSTSSKHSTSVNSNNESLTSLNDSTEISVGSSSTRSKSTSSKHSSSVISNNESSMLLNATVGSLKNNESQKTHSKHSISSNSYKEIIKSINSTTGISGRRSSSRNKSISSKHSNSENLPLLNAATVGSLKSNESQKTHSKHSISSNSYKETIKSTNSTTGISGKRSSSRNKSSLLTSKHSTSVVSNNDSLTLLNATTEFSVGSRLSRNQTQHSTSVISNNDSLSSFNATTMGSLENNKSLKSQSTSPTLNIENLTILNTTTGSLKQNELSINRSTSKYSPSVNSKETSINALTLDDINNVSRMSTRSSKQKSNCLSNVEPITSIINDGLSNSDSLTIKNATTGSIKQKLLSINQSNSSPNISIKSSTDDLILEGHANNISKMYTSLSKQKNKSYDNIEQIMPNSTDGPLIETRVLRSSLRINKNKSLLTKSLTTENNVNNLSIGSTRTSKNIVNFDNNSDDSLFWTTLPDDSTDISSTQNINMDTFQTPKRNKLSIAENIVNTIKIMSTNNKKSKHPGAFELDDHNDRPKRSFVTRSYNRSPSILTLVFGGKKTSESTSSLTRSPPEIIFDQSQVEENVKQKFKSLYKKESWITKRLYKFLIIKLQPNYNIYSVKYAEKFIKYLAQLFKQIYNDQVNLQLCTDMLRYHMARYHIIKDTFDYLEFLTDYIPMVYYKKLVPGWNLETSAVKFDPQKYYIPLMDDEEFLNYIMEHLNEA